MYQSDIFPPPFAMMTVERIFSKRLCQDEQEEEKQQK